MAILARRSGPRRRMLAEMNMVPYIDVMLVLVVILMVAAPFVNPSLVELPRVSKAGKQKETPIVVFYAADKRLTVRLGGKDRPADLPDVLATIKAEQAKREVPVVLAADAELKYREVMELLDKFNASGAKSVGLFVQPGTGR